MTMINKSMLSRPRKLTFPFGWCGHIPFVSWLVEEMKPGTIVELGTHSGNSYFAICQAVLENNTGSKCYAVDTWQGDEHAGSYSEDVFRDVNAWNQQYFSAFSNLMRMTFDQANEYFSAGSVNLLHIDGLHTYEAVKHDFESWKSKLADDAVVLFHDTNVRERGFGVWQLWDELQQQYPSFEFLHSYGLGVLFVGKKSQALYEKMASFGEPALIREAFSRLGELITLREEAHNHIQHIESARSVLESQNQELQHQLNKSKEENELYIKKIQDDKNIKNVMAGRIHELENSQHHISGNVHALEKEIERLINTNSWKITKPLRFMFRVLRGQQKDAMWHIKKEVRNIAKSAYYRTPYKYREQLLTMAFKVRPSWFTSHPKFMAAHSLISNELEVSDKLIDINLLSDDIKTQPGRIAVQCHIFYPDLIDEFVAQLSTMPFKFDVYISVTNKEAKQQCNLQFKKIKNIEDLDVRVVPNRGRDIAPVFAEFGSVLKQYDFVCHIQSKKSLYNEGKTTGWREYLLNGLFGSESNVKRIFKAFNDDKKLGIIYPQVHHTLPYVAFTWLANKQQGSELCAKMGIACPEGYFNFPAGSMFWARVDALAPLFDMNLTWQDFPEEKGQTDGTTAHAIERLLGIVPQALNYGSLIIKDSENESKSTFRWDQQYYPRTLESIYQVISDPSKKIIAFDIFDTLLIRPLLHPDHTKQIIARQLSTEEASEYLSKRPAAEQSARHRAGRDISIDDIYNELQQHYQIEHSVAKKLRELEERVELASVSARPDMLELFEFAKKTGKKIAIVSDMFLSLDTITHMLESNGYSGWDKIYLSSHEGKRKDTGELYELLLAEYGVSGNEVVMIGDNERSDIQLPNDRFNIHTIHLVRATDLALHTPEYTALAKQAYKLGLNEELTFGIVIKKNLSQIGNFSPEKVKLFSSNPYQIGYNLAGPLLTAFAEWLRGHASQAKIDDLYFLAREGKIIKEVYDLWCDGIQFAPKSHYLILSRRAVNVPNIKTLDDVLNIAKSTFFANTLEMFLRERYGLALSEETLSSLYTSGLWSKGKLVEIQNEDISEIRPLLEYLLPDILSEAHNEKQGLLQYLQQEGFLTSDHKTVVDVGYSGTIQKSLINILGDRVDGYYMATSEAAGKGLMNRSEAHGCFIDNSVALHNEHSLILRQSFELEKLLSSDDTQIVKYILENTTVTPTYKKQRPEELLTKDIRSELQKGCMDFVRDARDIRNALYPEFSPSLTIADSLYSEFISSCNRKENDFVKKMTLDDDYCGRGLVN
ncbi:rhamnan synthesis F family protein [Klebsiella aerogenes]|uniref:rhamnan synthesis F family protein n=1 Tax=Klebsiella aerogenes TaxID=548 RepID=UPI0027FA7E2A|nr:class I SAM-dependent methyltransferase [Klebsiella aerogenes]